MERIRESGGMVLTKGDSLMIVSLLFIVVHFYLALLVHFSISLDRDKARRHIRYDEVRRSLHR